MKKKHKTKRVHLNNVPETEATNEPNEKHGKVTIFSSVREFLNSLNSVLVILHMPTHTELCTNKCSNIQWNKMNVENRTTHWRKKRNAAAITTAHATHQLSQHWGKHTGEKNKPNGTEENSWHYLLRFELVLTAVSVKCVQHREQQREREKRVLN